MSKYSRDLKIIIANEFLSGESSEILSKKYMISTSHSWINK
ncbi:Mobile element protein [Gilliamella apicola]|nr:Mobile element protein [Gilliamella apicola]